MRALAVSRIHFPVTALGPGRRIGLWVQGCSIRCPGCISVDTWAPRLGLTHVDTVLQQLSCWAAQADGLTVSGGEPLDQPESLAAVLSGWRRQSARSVLLFTGYPFKRVQPWLEKYPGLVDAVVSGPYRRQMAQTQALRGSDNQELHILTHLGQVFAPYARPRGPDDRRLDVMFDAEGTAWFAGIPERGDFERLQEVLAKQGHQVQPPTQTEASR